MPSDTPCGRRSTGGDGGRGCRHRPAPFLDRRLGFGGDLFTWRQLQTSLLATGQTGSGKTTVLDVLLRELLAGGCGLYLPASKPGEGRRYLAMARGREALVIDRSGSVRVNFFQSLLGPDWKRDPATAALNLATGFDQLAQVLDRGGRGGGDSEAFWRGGYQRLLRNLLLLPLLCGRVPTVAMLLDVLQSVARCDDDVDTEKYRSGLCNQLLIEAYRRSEADPGLRHEYGRVCSFFVETFPNEPEKSRGTFEQMVNNPCDVLSRGLPHRLLCSDDPTLDLGRVVGDNLVLVSDLNPGEDAEVGVVVNAAVKYLLMRRVLARSVAADTLPFVFLMDEYQNVMSTYDAQYLPLQRSNRGPVVAAAQGLESLRQNFPGDTGEAQASVLTGNFGLSVFCSPTPATCEELVKRMGSVRRELFGGGTSTQTGAPPDGLKPQPTQVSGSFSESYTPRLTHEDLWALRTGEDGVVDFLVTAAGRMPRFASVRRGE